MAVQIDTAVYVWVFVVACSDAAELNKCVCCEQAMFVIELKWLAPMVPKRRRET